MKSCGFDLLLQIDEKLLNKALSAFFYTGKLKVKGVYDFVEGVPEELLDFTQVSYAIRLRSEPYIDFMDEGNVYINLAVEVVLNVLTGIRVELDIDLNAVASIKFDMDKKMLYYDLGNASISKIMLNDRLKFNHDVMKNLNKILLILLRHYVNEDIKRVEIPFSVFDFNLPYTTDNSESILDIRLADVILENNKILLGINLNGNNIHGAIYSIENTERNDLVLAIRTKTILDIMNMWWENTTIKKNKNFKGVENVSVKNIVAKSSDFLKRLLTLGIIQTESDIESAKLSYEGNVEIKSLPELEFDDKYILLNNLNIIVTIKAKLDANVSRKVYIDKSGFIPDNLTKFEDDILKSEENLVDNMLNIDETVNLTINKARCKVVANENGGLVLKIEKADLNLEMGDKWYHTLTEKGVNFILDFFEKTIIEKIPDITISPTMLLSDVKIFGYTYKIDDLNLEISKDELIVYLDITTNELSKGAVVAPLYIVNKNSKIIHRFDCKVVEDIDFSNRLGYYSLYEAINDGYKPCKDCLVGYEATIKVEV